MEALNQKRISASALLRRSDMANSPMHLFVQGSEEKRSQLFPERKSIPGRKAKTLIILGIILNIFGVKKIAEIRSH